MYSRRVAWEVMFFKKSIGEREKGGKMHYAHLFDLYDGINEVVLTTTLHTEKERKA